MSSAPASLDMLSLVDFLMLVDLVRPPIGGSGYNSASETLGFGLLELLLPLDRCLSRELLAVTGECSGVGFKPDEVLLLLLNDRRDDFFSL
jgi:hypothetical protein